MKILLVYPFFLDDRINEEDVSAIPMGLYYVGAMLRAHGYAVEILNAYNLGQAPHRIYQIIGESSPDVVGFSILHANRWGGIDIARMVKKVNPQITVVFGGVGATFLWENLLTHFEQIDYVVRGEGEHTFLELVRWLENRPTGAPETIPGLALRDNGRPMATAERQPIADLDSLPMPADYFAFQHLSLTRGCPSGCTFCGSPALWHRRVRFHSAAYFVGQIQRLEARGIRFFFVSDDTFTLKRNLVIEICQAIIEQGLPITWAAISRVDCVDGEMLFWMRRAGCTQISYGVESGSPEIRDLYRKNISDDAICRAFDLTVRYGIMARAYFIYGAPTESHATIEASIALIERIRPLAAIFYMLDLFPGTALYEDYKRQSGADDDIWLERIEDILYFETDGDLSREQVLEFGQRLRAAYFGRLPDFARRIELEEDPELFPWHADFLSRLAMTFSHGEYAQHPQIDAGLETAIHLYERALGYHPDHRAFWGLGLVLQHQRRFEASAAILQKGIDHHPASADLRMALANSLMRLEAFSDACRWLEPVADQPQVLELLVRCCRLMGDREGEKKWTQQLAAASAKHNTESSQA